MAFLIIAAFTIIIGLTLFAYSSGQVSKSQPNVVFAINNGVSFFS